MTAPPRLNRLLCLESASLSPDGAGGVSRFWNELGWHWVDMRPGSAGEVAEPELRASRVSWTISLRAAAPGTAARPIPGQRLRDGSRIFAILAVRERVSDARFLDCICHEEIRT